MSVQRGQGWEGPPEVLALVQTCDQCQQGPRAREGTHELTRVCGHVSSRPWATCQVTLLAGVGEPWLPWAWVV